MTEAYIRQGRYSVGLDWGDGSSARALVICEQRDDGIVAVLASSTGESISGAFADAMRQIPFGKRMVLRWKFRKWKLL